MVRKTSIEAYNQIKNNGLLSERRMQVYDLLYKYGPLTALQVIDHFRRTLINFSSTGNLSTRLSELRDMGVVEELGTTKCPIGGRNVILWDVTDRLPVKVEKKKKTKCPFCNGTGKQEQK